MVGLSWSRLGSTAMALWTALSLVGAPFRAFCPMHGVTTPVVESPTEAHPPHHHPAPNTPPDQTDGGVAPTDQSSSHGAHHGEQPCECTWCCTGGPPVTPDTPTLQLSLDEATSHQPLRPDSGTLQAPRPPPHTLPFATAPPSA